MIYLKTYSKHFGGSVLNESLQCETNCHVVCFWQLVCYLRAMFELGRGS
jgi:hypothetical protein